MGGFYEQKDFSISTSTSRLRGWKSPSSPLMMLFVGINGRTRGD